MRPSIGCEICPGVAQHEVDGPARIDRAPASREGAGALVAVVVAMPSHVSVIAQQQWFQGGLQPASDELVAIRSLRHKGAVDVDGAVPTNDDPRGPCPVHTGQITFDKLILLASRLKGMLCCV